MEFKEEILNFLAEKTETSTTEIASKMNRGYYDTLKFLEELESEGIIEKIKLNKYTFWKVKNGQKI
jgi:Mn-dependent DtxR family transcriptional regulator